MILGSVVVDEIILPIEQMTLEHGRVIFWAHRSGPIPARERGFTDVEIFGRDGTSIGSVWVYIPGWPDLEPGGTLTVPFPIMLTSMSPVGGEAEANSP